MVIFNSYVKLPEGNWGDRSPTSHSDDTFDQGASPMSSHLLCSAVRSTADDDTWPVAICRHGGPFP